MTIDLPTESEPVRIIEGDCLEALPCLPTGCVDAVVTDPPYPQEFWPAVEGAVKEFPRILKDGGEAIVLVGHHMMPHVLRWAETAGLRYWWVCGMLQHCSNKLFGKRVAIYWKPALWFVKGKKRRQPDMPMDMLKGNRPEKKLHKWEQGVSWFDHWCDRICHPGELVLDPFAGSGTTGIAAINKGRRCILIERDPAYAAIARKRVEAAMCKTGLFEGVA